VKLKRIVDENPKQLTAENFTPLTEGDSAVFCRIEAGQFMVSPDGKSRFFALTVLHSKTAKELVLVEANEAGSAVAAFRDGRMNFRDFFGRGAALFIVRFDGTGKFISMNPTVAEGLPRYITRCFNQSCNFTTTAAKYNYAASLFADVS
jgi:hypothetical protein